MTKQRFTKGEEIANSISHGLGVVFAVVALVLMLASANNYGTGWHVVSYSVYGAFLVLLYISSTLNHSLRSGSRGKNFFHNFDQIAIFLFIAATYTPLSLIVLKGDWGWVMFGLAWGFALTGVVVKILIPNKFEKGVNIFYVIAYLVMGFIFVLFLIPLYRHMHPMGVGFIIIGAACYGLGVFFFKMEKMKYTHLIWHLFVIAGSVCHWIAIYRYTINQL